MTKRWIQVLMDFSSFPFHFTTTWLRGDHFVKQHLYMQNFPQNNVHSLSHRSLAEMPCEDISVNTSKFSHYRKHKFTVISYVDRWTLSVKSLNDIQIAQTEAGFNCSWGSPLVTVHISVLVSRETGICFLPHCLMKDYPQNLNFIFELINSCILRRNNFYFSRNIASSYFSTLFVTLR